MFSLWLFPWLCGCSDVLMAGSLDPFVLMTFSLFALNLSWWANMTCKTDLASYIFWSNTYLRNQITSKGCACGPAEIGTLRQAPETRRAQRTSPAWAGRGRAPTWGRRPPGWATGDGRWARAPCSCNKSGQFDERIKRDSSWRPERWTGSVRWWWGLEWESRLEKVKENSIW